MFLPFLFFVACLRCSLSQKVFLPSKHARVTTKTNAAFDEPSAGATRADTASRVRAKQHRRRRRRNARDQKFYTGASHQDRSHTLRQSCKHSDTHLPHFAHHHIVAAPQRGKESDCRNDPSKARKQPISRPVSSRITFYKLKLTAHSTRSDAILARCVVLVVAGGAAGKPERHASGAHSAHRHTHNVHAGLRAV